MCSTGKRSFGGDSDDDFDDSLHKRLKIRRRETKVKTKGTGNSKAKQSRQRLQVRIQKIKNVSTQSTSSYNTSESSTDTVTNSIIAHNGSMVNEESRNEDECLDITPDTTSGIAHDQSSGFNRSNDSRLSADQIISDILGDSIRDECDDTTVTVSAVHRLTTVTTSSIQSVQRLPEVPSPKKQSSLFQYFKLKGRKSISGNPHQSNSNDGTNKNCLAVSSKMTTLTRQSTKESNFSKKSKRYCPFYKKIPGTSCMKLGGNS